MLVREQVLLNSLRGGGNITYMYQLYLAKAKCRRGWESEVEFIIIVDQNVLDLLLDKGTGNQEGGGVIATNSRHRR